MIDADQANNVVVHGAQLTPEVDLTLTKDDGQTEAIPGLPVTYTITLSNAGPSDLAAGELEDLFPAIFEEPAWSCVATSAVAFVEAEVNGAGGVTGMDAPQGVVIAPDPDGAFGPAAGGDFVYVASRASNAHRSLRPRRRAAASSPSSRATSTALAISTASAAPAAWRSRPTACISTPPARPTMPSRSSRATPRPAC